MELAACLFEVDFSCLVPLGSNESVMGIMPLRVMGVLLGVPLRGMGCLGEATGCLEGVMRVSWGTFGASLVPCVGVMEMPRE